MAVQRPERRAVKPPARTSSAGGRLTGPERARLAAEILAAYAQAKWTLRRSPIADVVAGLRSRSPAARPASPETLEEARSLGWSVARVLAHAPGDTRCLARSLVLTRLLASRGITARLVIGARPAPDFLAHAWVEYEGEPVLNPGDGSFGRLVEL
jgi:hypothetical protein